MGEVKRSVAAPATPFVVRLAGLHREALAPLRNRALLDLLTDVEELTERLEAGRGGMVDLIFDSLSDAPSDLRSRLLAIKRDCFNGRPLRRHWETPAWGFLEGAFEAECRALQDIESRSDALWVAYESAYDAAIRDALAELYRQVSENLPLQRGLALASPILAKTLRKRGGNLEGMRRRKKRKLDQSLLRYLTRAAFKTSPYSTLTPIGLGRLVDDADGEPRSESLAAQQSERSFLRARRFQLEQIFHMFCRLPAGRAALRVGLNRSLQPVGEDWVFLRPARWVPDADSKSMRSTTMAPVRGKLPSGILGHLQDILSTGALPYGDCVARIAARLVPEAPAAETSLADGSRLLDRLIGMGTLDLYPPWASHAEHLEKELAELLRRVRATEAAAQSLERIVDLESGFPTATEPEDVPSAVDHHVDEAFRIVACAAGHEGLEVFRPRANDVYEDVLARSTRDDGTFLDLPRSKARGLLDTLGPWCEIAQFLDLRFDFLHTLSAAALKAGGGGESLRMPALKVFSAYSTLWKEFRAFLRQGAEDAWKVGFNPLELELVERLGALRRDVWGRLESHAAGTGGALDPAVLAEILELVPAAYRAKVGACLFLQPLDQKLDTWVANRVFEGTGRYSSRFVSLLEPESREAYLRATADAGPASVLDLLWNRGDSLNTHPPQTERVLLAPGDDPTEHGEAGTSVADLMVTFRQGELPTLELADGRPLQPRFLGGSAVGFLPQWLQFLHVWAPPQLGRLQPPTRVEEKDGVRFRGRTCVGDVVILRRRWWVPRQAFAVSAGQEQPSRRFAEIRETARRLELPSRVFWIEPLYHPAVGTVFKPQYLDFDSPLLVDLFLSNLPAEGDLILEEALPVPESFLADDEGGRAVEIVVDRSRFT